MSPLRPASRWYPDRTRTRYARPDVGDLIAMGHAVWRVCLVEDVPVLDDDDIQAWEDEDRPDPATWRGRPYLVRVAYVGGHIAPDWPVRNEPTLGGPGRYGNVRVKARDARMWHVYEGGRWPACSCCGEPMPCRAEREDDAVRYAVEVSTEHERKMPGCCWACNEPVTSRQESVRFDGMNLDLPTAPPPQFHTRAKCVTAAMHYEERWRAGDPDRPRILTYPRCTGDLVCHSDAFTECHGGEDDCMGHDTHDHDRQMACSTLSGGCPRMECALSDVRWIVLPKRKRRNVRAAP